MVSVVSVWFAGVAVGGDWVHDPFLQHAWPSEDMPIPYRLSGDCPEELGPGACEAVVHAVFGDYSSVSCSHLAYAHDPTRPAELDLSIPGVSVDFSEDFDEPALLSLSITQRIGYLEEGELFAATSAWIAFSDDLDLTTNALTAAGQCTKDQTNLDRLLVSHIGAISGPRDVWSVSGACEPSPGVTAEIAAQVRALYGPRFAIVCNPAIDRPVAAPFTARCTLASRDHLPDLTAAHWSFSDGGVGEGLSVEHTFATAGVHEVNVQVDGASADCPDWDAEVASVALVRACDAPLPAFTLEPVGRLTWAARNLTPIDVYGCLSDLSWRVFAGDRETGEPIASLDSRHWEPEFRLPREGRYTVVLHVGGVAGTRAAKLTFDAVQRTAGVGCN